MLDFLHPEPGFEQAPRALQVLCGNGDVEVLGDDRLGRGVYAHASDHAVADPVLLQEADDPFEEVGVVGHDGLPESKSAHKGTVQQMGGARGVVSGP